MQRNKRVNIIRRDRASNKSEVPLTNAGNDKAEVDVP